MKHILYNPYLISNKMNKNMCTCTYLDNAIQNCKQNN